MVRGWLLDTEEKDRLRDVLKEILAEAEGHRPEIARSISSALAETAGMRGTLIAQNGSLDRETGETGQGSRGPR